jgi:hypothetical protein
MACVYSFYRALLWGWLKSNPHADRHRFWSLFGILANAPDMRTNGRAPT